MRRGGSGFTLIELMVTLALVGILAAGLFPLAELDRHREREQELRRALREMREAIDAYKKAADEGRVAKAADASGYPPSLEVLADGVADAKRTDAAKIYFLRRLPADPFAPAGARGGGDARAAARTWGKRSYASTPDAPAAGADVFDVYSMAEGSGLNGVPYRQW